MKSTNGSASTQLVATDIKVIESSVELAEASQEQQKKTKAKKPKPNTICHADVVLDAGSKRLKIMIDGFENSIESVYKEVKGDLPSGRAGCFSYKNKNYFVGEGCDSVLGEAVRGFEDNKISKLDIWLIGALTSDPDFLDELIESDRFNKYKDRPINVHIDLKLLSLSSSKRGDIAKILGSIKTFTYRGREFAIAIKNLASEFIYSEGFGAALTAAAELPEGVKEFHILDLGGGTLTLTRYHRGRKRPKAIEQTVASGGGMQVLGKRIYVSFSKEDVGGQEKHLSGIFAALKSCRKKDEGFSVPYRLGNQNIDISQSVIDGLSSWISENPTIENVLTKTSQALNDGHHVFATGGGFGAGIVADWLEGYVTSGIDSPNFKVLEAPHIINVTGMEKLNT